MLDSPAFEASERRRQFLCYIVDETLAGRADRLKGYSVATAVFERDDGFDPQTDPVVRLEARRLRRALEYYHLTAGRDDPIRIDVPKGGYVPVFERRPRAPPEAPVPAGTSRPPTAPRLRRGGRSLLGPALPSGTLAVLLGATLVAALLAWSWLARAPSERGEVQAAAESPPVPAVIVRPFASLSGTEADGRFAEGLTEELVAGLTRFGDLQVYAGADDPRDGASLHRRLAFHYDVKGSVRRAAGGMRTTVHLIEHGSGRYLWSETDQRPLGDDDGVAVQAALAAELAGHLGGPYGVVRQVTAQLDGEARPEILRTYDCVSQAYAYRRTFSPADFRAARACLDEAVRREPSRPDAWAMLAFSHVDEYYWYDFGSRSRQPELLEQALAAAVRARELDRDSALSQMAYAYVQFARGRLDEAEVAGRRAVALNPNLPEAWVYLGYRLAFTRDWDRGMAMVRRAIERSRAPDGWYYILPAIDDYHRGDYRQALADVARIGGPFFFLSPALVAMSQAQLGNQEPAARALQEALAADPMFAKDPRGTFRLYSLPEDVIEEFMDGLRKAGLDDPAT